jgi:RNase H-fold protein (predicted Holliday junction resolvase)
VGLPIHYHEETLTSWEAERAAPGLSKEEIDREAAALLLTDYLAHTSEGRT